MMAQEDNSQGWKHSFDQRFPGATILPMKSLQWVLMFKVIQRHNLMYSANVYPHGDLGQDKHEDILFRGLIWQTSFHLNEASLWCEQSGNLTRDISMETKGKQR